MDVREKLVELLNEAFFDYNHGKGDGYIPKNFADHLVANGVTVQEWISVEDRLPENDGSYLVTMNSFGGRKYIGVRWFAKDGEAVNEYELAGQENVWYYHDSEWGYISIDSVTPLDALAAVAEGE